MAFSPNFYLLLLGRFITGNTVGPASQCYSDELMILKFKLMLLKCELMLLKCEILLLKCELMLLKCELMLLKSTQKNPQTLF